MISLVTNILEYYIETYKNKLKANFQSKTYCKNCRGCYECCLELPFDYKPQICIDTKIFSNVVKISTETRFINLEKSCIKLERPLFHLSEQLESSPGCTGNDHKCSI